MSGEKAAEVGRDSAFPLFVNNGPGDTGAEHGLTKREHFAGLAMQGLLALNEVTFGDTYDDYKKRTADSAVEYADALLLALTSRAEVGDE